MMTMSPSKQRPASYQPHDHPGLGDCFLETESGAQAQTAKLPFEWGDLVIHVWPK